jgi:hypothetical protein
MLGQLRVLEKDDVVIRVRCGHGVPHALQSPLLAVGRLPTGMPGAPVAAVSPRRFQKLPRRCPHIEPGQELTPGLQREMWEHQWDRRP